jgi:hypothetical protein
MRAWNSVLTPSKSSSGWLCPNTASVNSRVDYSLSHAGMKSSADGCRLHRQSRMVARSDAPNLGIGLRHAGISIVPRSFLTGAVRPPVFTSRSLCHGMLRYSVLRRRRSCLRKSSAIEGVLIIAFAGNLLICTPSFSNWASRFAFRTASCHRCPSASIPMFTIRKSTKYVPTEAVHTFSYLDV